MAGARIALVGDDDEIVISDPTDDSVVDDGFVLNVSPTGIFGTGFTTKTISLAGQIGGREGSVDVPIRQVVFAVEIHDIGEGVAAQVSRFRKLFGTMINRRKVQWQYTTDLSGMRWLVTKLANEIAFTPEQDWELEGSARAVVTANAYEPRYEAESFQVVAQNPTAGENTLWIPTWNPTDQEAWPIWSLNPNGGPATFSYPDFGFGNEQEIDAEWTPGMHDDRMITTKPISVMWSVMAEPLMDTYVAADLSNAPAQMEGVEPLYAIPPYTGTEDDPIMLPVVIDGPAGAQVMLTLRRHWSAESGLE